MWWRTLGVAVVLLCVGLAGGYALADRASDAPATSRTLQPVPAVSPAVPTPPQFEILPDPTAEALGPDLPNHEEELRITRRGAGASLVVPDGWLQSRLPDSQTWSYAPEINTKNTYGMRVSLMIGQRLAITVAKTARLAALQSAEDDGNIEGLEITAQTDDSFQATYILEGYLKVTMERWVAGDDGLAYADIAVTGRTVDQEGMGDLLARAVESARYLEPLPPEEKDARG
jgi:hypothetical protein